MIFILVKKILPIVKINTYFHSLSTLKISNLQSLTFGFMSGNNTLTQHCSEHNLFSIYVNIKEINDTLDQNVLIIPQTVVSPRDVVKATRPKKKYTEGITLCTAADWNFCLSRDGVEVICCLAADLTL